MDPSGLTFHSRVATSAAQELADARAHFFLARRFGDPFGNHAFVEYDAHDLLIVATEDAVENKVTAQNDYRVLQPRVMTDPNGNRTAAAFDALGLVAGTALMGKATEGLGDSLAAFRPDLTRTDLDQFFANPKGPIAADLLAGATTRIVYDVDRFRHTRQANPLDSSAWLPAYASTLARETHASDPVPPDVLKIQVSASYSDGFGREIQKKIQAEPGPLDPNDPAAPIADPRWVGSGWTVLNNKGQPVRHYEPFFDDSHEFRFGKQVGVSAIVFYDPVERVVGTVHPNHTWEKVVFDPWRQTTWDVNDTLLLDPRADPDVGNFFSRLPAADYLPTWNARRTTPALALERWPGNDPLAQRTRQDEQAAALKTAVHPGTPTAAWFDSLGRGFLTIAYNRFQQDQTIVEERYRTAVERDIEGNQREVIDDKDRVVMRYDYDMLGNRIHQASAEAGERWMLNDAAGQPIRAWDSRGFAPSHDV